MDELSYRNDTFDVPSLASEYFQWSFKALIEHILLRHHRSAATAIAQISGQLIEIPKPPGIGGQLYQYPIVSAGSEWIECMEYMEQEVFAYIVALSQINDAVGERPRLNSGSLSDAISSISQSRDRFKAAATITEQQIRENIYHSSTDFSLLEIDDLLVRLLKDMPVQSFLEESVLFPRALRLEREMEEQVGNDFL